MNPSPSSAVRSGAHLQSALVIGIGNEFRQDDGAGVAVARRLAHHGPDRFAVVEHDGEATSLLEAWSGARTVVLVDAVRSGSPPGTIHYLDARVAEFADDAAWSSSHSLGVREAVALGRLFDRLPATLLVYGIEGERFDPGTGLSAEVDRAAWTVVELLLGEGNRFTTTKLTKTTKISGHKRRPGRAGAATRVRRPE